MKSEIRNERARVAQGERAGFVSQLVATGLDLATVFVLDFAVLAAYGFARFLVTDKPYEIPQPGPGGNFALFLTVGVLLLWTSWSGSGRAPGMAVMGLRVVGPDGRTPTSRRAFWRAVLAVATLGLGVLLVLVSKRNKSLYDMWCRTGVVYAWRPASLESRQKH